MFRLWTQPNSGNWTFLDGCVVLFFFVFLNVSSLCACPHTLPSPECSECKFHCTNGNCLRLGSLICNQLNNCGDNSDEENCPVVTQHPPPGIFNCEYCGMFLYLRVFPFSTLQHHTDPHMYMYEMVACVWAWYFNLTFQNIYSYRVQDSIYWTDLLWQVDFKSGIGLHISAKMCGELYITVTTDTVKEM